MPRISARYTTPVLASQLSLPSALAIVRESSAAGGTGRGIRVDEELTERRDEAWVNGIERTQETRAELRFLGHKPATSVFG